MSHAGDETYLRCGWCDATQFDLPIGHGPDDPVLCPRCFDIYRLDLPDTQEVRDLIDDRIRFEDERDDLKARLAWANQRLARRQAVA